MHGAVTATSHRFHCVFSRTQIHGATFVHGQSANRRMAFYNLLGDPTATNKDVVALLAMWYSQTFFCRHVFEVFVFYKLFRNK